jgi:hypothetical protein
VDVEKEVEFVKVNLMKGEHKQPGFLLKNVSLCCVVCLAPPHLELVEMLILVNMLQLISAHK